MIGIFGGFSAPLQYMPICIGYPISERNSTNIWSISAWLSHRWHRHGHGYMRKRERGRERYLCNAEALSHSLSRLPSL